MEIWLISFFQPLNFNCKPIENKAKGATEMTHTMIVTKVENGEPYLSYHTDDQIDQPLSSMLKGEKKWYPQRT